MPRKAPLPGDLNYRPASGIPAGGAGIGGAASGKAAKAFAADTQPPADLKSAGQAAKAEMVAYLVSKQKKAADRIVTLIDDEKAGAQVQLNASIALLNRLHGTPAATLALANADDVPLAVTYKWQDDG